MFGKIWGCGRAVVLAAAIGLAAALLTEVETIPDGAAGSVVQPKDVVFINKTAYLYGEPKKGDTVAVLNYLHKEGGSGAIRVLRVCAAEDGLFEAADGSIETVPQESIIGRVDAILWPRGRQRRL